MGQKIAVFTIEIW